MLAGVALDSPYSAPQAQNVGPHSPPEDRQARLSGAGRANLHAKREYPATGGRTFPAFSTLKFFKILQMHFGDFGSVDRFEPAK